MNKSSTTTRKIFGIGLNKTGTTTLAEMGRTLNFRCTSCDRRLLEDFVLRGDFSRIQEKVEHYDLFEDWPWPLVYRQLDCLYPGSKFVLTIRKSEEVWFESLRKHSFRTHPTKHCRKLAYGFNFPEKNKQRHIDFYRRHNDGIREYFEGRSNDFIELCWENGDGYNELCSFLQVDCPNVITPHANSARDAAVSWKYWAANKILSQLNI